MLRGENEILRVGWLPYHDFIDVLTTIFDRVFRTVMLPYTIESVSFPLSTSLIIRYTCYELLDAIPAAESLKIQDSAFFLRHIVIVHLNALLLDSTLDIFVLFMRHKWEVGIVVIVTRVATKRIVFLRLRNSFAQWSIIAGICILTCQRSQPQLRLRVCDNFNMFEVRSQVQLFD